MNFHFTFVALFVSIIYSSIRRFWFPEPYPWKLMGTFGLVLGCFQILTNILLPKGIKRENVQVITIIGSFDILYAVILQYIFFRQTKSWIFYIGASLIVSSAVILSIDRHLETKRKRKHQSMKLIYPKQ
jgi:drug/metabolite transporter (DMT)-like permease